MSGGGVNINTQDYKPASEFGPLDCSWKFCGCAVVVLAATATLVAISLLQIMRTDVPQAQNALNDNLNKAAAIDADLQKVNAQLAANPPADLRSQLLHYKSFLEAEKSSLMEAIDSAKHKLHVYSTLPDELLYAIGPVAVVGTGAGAGAIYFGRKAYKDYKAARIV
jgi:hypothetical protein